MTRRHPTSPPSHLPARMRRRRQSINDNDLNDNPTTIPDNDNIPHDDTSKFSGEPLWRTSGNGMDQQTPKDSFTSTLGNTVAAPQCTAMQAKPQHLEHWEVCHPLEDDDQSEAVPLASNTILD